ncbi:MAG TPA: VOC family protein [Bacteroidales bacterium]|nr:VOC family protein [Bacteroidales bacterium]
MNIDHIAIWTHNLEGLKEYYTRYFGATPNNKYTNKEKQFESYFLSFSSGSRLELMQMPGIPPNMNDTMDRQHTGLIHISFGVDSMGSVRDKAEELKRDGYPVLRGPRRTGDGYFEFETLDPDNNRIEVSSLFTG